MENASASSQDNLGSNSTNLLNGKHFVSREQLSTSEMTSMYFNDDK